MSGFRPVERNRRFLLAGMLVWVAMPVVCAVSLSGGLGPAPAAADHHETDRQAEPRARPGPSEVAGEPAPAELRPETRDEKISRLASEVARLLELGVEIGKTGRPQQTALQQRQRDGAQGALISARDAAREFARVVDSGASLNESDPYFRTVRIRFRTARQTAGDARPTPEGARLLAELDVALGELGRIYDER